MSSIDRRRFLHGCGGMMVAAAGAGGFSASGQDRIKQPANGSTTMKQRIIDDLKKWDSITDHRTGTAGDHSTADWLAAEIRRAGLTPVLDRLPFRRRVLHDCSVTVGNTRIPGVPLFDGGVTGQQPIRKKLAKDAGEDSILLTRFSPQPSAPTTRAMLSARARKNQLAIVAVASGDSVAPGLALLNADDYQKPYGPPVLQVATEHGGLLDEALAKGDEVEFVAHVTLEQTSAINVQVTIAGQDQELKPLVVMTPRSAWWTCTSERGGGITAWLETMRHFANHRPDRTIIFTANTGHELGHVGLDHYLEANHALIRNAHAWIHLGANFAARDGTLLLQASNQSLMNVLQSSLGAYDQSADRVTPIDQRPLGEARNIYDGKGRFVSILGGNPLFHHPNDRWPDAIDLERTESLTQGMVDVAVHLARRVTDEN